MTNEEIQKSLDQFRKTDICKANRHQLAHMTRRREVYQYDQCGNQITVFKHRKEAAEKTKMPEASIGQVCIGNTKHAGGFIFSYGPRTFTEQELIEIQQAIYNSTVKKVVMYDLKGNLINVFNNAVEAAEKTGFDDISIRYSCTEKRNWKGYEWRWRLPDEKIPKKIKILYKNNGTEVIVYDVDKKLVGEFSSIATAAKHLGYTERKEQRYFSSTFNKNKAKGINKPIKGYYFEIKDIAQ